MIYLTLFFGTYTAFFHHFFTIDEYYRYFNITLFVIAIYYIIRSIIKIKAALKSL